MSIIDKVFARILNEKVKVVTVDKVMDEQRSFRSVVTKSRSEANCGKTIEKDGKLYNAFVDLEKTYDNVSKEKLWKVLDEYGVQGKLIRAIRHCMWMPRQG